ENKFDINQSVYTCQCDSVSSEIKDNPTNAITSLYKQIFKTQTKISGLMVIDFDKESIFNELLHNIEFCSYSISLKKVVQKFIKNKSIVEVWKSNIKISQYEGQIFGKRLEF
ncbi:5605_t:CDS:2, partial [Funneliformis geosporum]